jgi:putative flippase GtrA
MAMTLPGVLERVRGPAGKKLFRYCAVSAIGVVISSASLLFFVGVLRMGAVWASTLATAIATVPSYELNRKWAWGKTGKSHLLKEVTPFWVLSFIGWAFSTLCVRIAESDLKDHHASHAVRTGLLGAVYIGAFGVLWIGKFIIFNKVLFAHHPEELPPALDGRTGIPG